MPQLHLTEIVVRGLKGSDQYVTYFDAILPGFGIRVGKRSKTFVVVRGRKRERVSIGRYPNLSLAEARTKARRLLSNEPEPKAKRLTWAMARDEFLETNYRDSTSDWPHHVELMLKKHYRPLDDRQLGSITDADIKRCLDAIEGPSARLHAFRVARTFLRWGTKPPRRYLPRSPMEGYDAPGSDRKRSRVLTDDELKKVWLASGAGSRRVFRLLILWGTRSKETCRLARAWAATDEGSNDRVLTIPGFENGKRVTKNGRDHSIPILPLAEEVLAGSPTGEYYFPGQRADCLQAGSLHGLRREIQKETGVIGWGAHDLRRTFRSNMARLKVPREICEVLLNHAPPVLDEIYDRYDRLPEKREALQRYEEFLLKLTGSAD